MNNIRDLIGLVRDELGLMITLDDIERELDELPGWDSMHLLWLVTQLEQRTGRSVTVIDVLEAPNLESIYGLVASH